MISSTKCASIDDTSRVAFNTHELSGNTDTALSRVINICNLPVELKQKIAFDLNSKDYASLRATGKSMSESLDSFSVMSHRLKQESFSGETERNIREMMCDILIRNLLDSDQTKEITLSLKNCFVRPHPIFEETTMAGTEYLPDSREQDYPDRIDEVITLCRKGVNNMILSGEHRSFEPKLFPEKLWSSTVNFNNTIINTDSLNNFFSSFNKVYHDSEGAEKLVVATLASKLKDYWCETPPNDVKKEDISNLSVACPELFCVGDKAKKVLLESKR